MRKNNLARAPRSPGFGLAIISALLTVASVVSPRSSGPQAAAGRQAALRLADTGSSPVHPTTVDPASPITDHSAPSGFALLARIARSYGSLPLLFEPLPKNSSFAYAARGAGYLVSLNSDGAVLSFSARAAEAWSGTKTPGNPEVRLTLVGANPRSLITAQDKKPGRSNYLIGRDPAEWRTGVPQFGRVVVTETYPRIDMAYHGAARKLEYDFMLRPGADPNSIRVRFDGVERLAVDPSGALVLKLSGHEIRFEAPVSYQESAKGREVVASRYLLRTQYEVGFEIGAYDRSRDLVIDPVLNYSTFYGAGGDEGGYGIAVDSAGNALVTGWTGSTSLPSGGPRLYPYHGAGSTVSTISQGGDAFVTKLNAAGTAVLYSTYLGGAGDEVGKGIAVDAQGNAWVVGWTKSLNDFPTLNPILGGSALKGTRDAFVVKLSAAGDQLLFGTYLGGTLDDQARAVAVTGANAYVTGRTNSSDFPVWGPGPGPGGNVFHDSGPGGSDAFVTNLTEAGAALATFSDYLGGTSADDGYGIVVGPAGFVFVTGETISGSTFPYGANTGLPAYGQKGGSDAFVTKIASTGILDRSTLIGGTGLDYGRAIASDPADANWLWVTGETSSTNFIGPSAPVSTTKATPNAFAARLTSGTLGMFFMTYVGGNGDDYGYGIAMDGSGFAYLTGHTNSSDFPTSIGTSERDAFVVKLKVAGEDYALRLGGGSWDEGRGIAVDLAGNAFVTGYTQSGGATPFPTTVGVFQPAKAAGADVFVTKIGSGLPPPVLPSATSPTSVAVGATTASLGGNVTSDGGSAITSRGVVYAVTASNGNPQINGPGVTDASTSGTTGTFAVSVSGLTASTGYSFKAYATNAVGTGYSLVGTFTTNSSGGGATQIALNAGNNQAATAGTAVTMPPSVIVRDAGNNPVSGVLVTFAVAAGGGSVTGAAQNTNGSGVATVGNWTLGPGVGAGNNTLTATSSGLTGSPITFTASGTAPSPIAGATLLGPTITQVEASGQHTCVLTTSGGPKCWGQNDYGQVGDGTTSFRTMPVDVSGLASGVASLAAGQQHTCALTVAGGVKCWGRNDYGALGDGTTAARAIAGDVAGLTSGVASVAGGWYHTCALTVAGGVKCWGLNSFAGLGDGTTTNRTTPVDVAGLTSGVVRLTAGRYHSCAVTTAGGMKCWGRNSYGQLGDGTFADHAMAADVSGLTSGVSRIAANENHTCALTAAGGVKCWGRNDDGQLGDGTTTDRGAPVDVSGLASGVANIAAGEFHVCALTTTGAVKCWGQGVFGQLGDGATTQRNTPVASTGLTSGVTALSAGNIHSCALTSGGGVMCWGGGLIGTFAGPTTARDVVGLASGVVRLWPGEVHTCAVTTAGGAKCWGSNFSGQLGDGTTTSRLAAVEVSGLTTGVASIAAGPAHTCALTTGGGVKCWGANSSGYLGDGTTTNRTVPVDVAGLASGVASVAAGQGHTCALTTGGGAKCWGYNLDGRLGDGSTLQRTSPVDVSGLSSGVAAIATGYSHTCALTTAGGVKCWGNNSGGALGDGTATSRNTPVNVIGLSSGVASISAGGGVTCAVTEIGGLKCWGSNGFGVGDGTATSRSTPVDVLGLTSGVASVSVGEYHTCASTAGGGAMCWGANDSGQLGDGTTTGRLTAVPVSGLTSGAAAILAGGFHACALTAGGQAKCWGNNSSGQLGDGTTTPWNAPVTLRAGQSVAFSPPSALIVGTPALLSATATSGLPATFDSWTPLTCTVTGNSVTAIANALCGLRASQAGDSNNAPAPQGLRLLATVGVAFPPTVTSPSSGFFGPTTATLGATVTSDGGSPVTARGFAYSATAANPSPQIGGSGVTLALVLGTTGALTVDVAGLTSLTGYSFTAFATNALGTTYTSVATFTTAAPPSRVFVSSSGSDASGCSTQTAPCRNLAEAINQVAIDGEVIVLTAGEYETAPLVITKGVKLTSPSGTVAFIRQPITVNAPGGRVVLRGLTIKGSGSGAGITLVAADALSIEETTIDRWSTGLSLSNSSGARLFVLGSIFRGSVRAIADNGASTQNRASIEETRFEGSGVALDVYAGAFSVRESSFLGAGVLVGPGSADIQRSEFFGCGTAIGTYLGGAARVGRSRFFGNGTALAIVGGLIESSGTNVLRGNTINISGAITVVPEP